MIISSSGHQEVPSEFPAEGCVFLAFSVYRNISGSSPGAGFPSKGSAVIVAAIVRAAKIYLSEQNPDTASDLPAWVYGFDNTTEGPRPDSPDSEARGGKDDGTLRHLPGSTRSFTLTQIRDNSGPADWYPEDHPAMPEIVAH